jgi:5-formyltetrahydrofolate cyclo-ligase
MKKTLIRKRVLSDRKQLDSLTYTCLSQQAQQQLIGSDCFSRAKILALYSPINNEVATEQIFTAAEGFDKKICYPRVNGDDLEFIVVDSVNDLVPGIFGVAEPLRGEKLFVEGLDLIVVPGVAFDLDGYRLGYGCGYYDRQLAEIGSDVVTVGLCFEFQLCDLLPNEAHDQRLDFIATETRFIPCHADVAGLL